MFVLEIVRVALRGLAANKLRSGLTMLGIVVGVGSVIVLIAFSEGQKAELLKRFANWGANRIDVFIGYRSSAEGNAAGWESLSLADADAIREEVSSAELVVPSVYTETDIRAGGISLTGKSVIGSEPGVFVIENAALTAGRYFDDDDNLLRERVCVLDSQAKYELFYDAPAVGKDIYIGGKRFEVIGVLEERGGRRWMSVDDDIYVPLLTGQDALRMGTTVSDLSINLVDPKYADLATTQIRELLHFRHPRIPVPTDPDPEKAEENDPIWVRSVGKWRQEREQTADSMQKFLVIMGALSLFIGGVGVMNIMLVTVQERTREIGLRKAVGASRHSVLSQFLLESVVLCTLGGTIGTLMAITACKYMAKLPEEAKIPDPVVTPVAIGIAVAVTVGVGLFFGVYPAAKAAQLEPISALRYE